MFFAGASDALEWAQGIISDDGCCKAFVQFLSLLLWFINTGLCVLIGLSLNVRCTVIRRSHSKASANVFFSLRMCLWVWSATLVKPEKQMGCL